MIHGETSLSKRQKQVAELLLQGKSNKQIALELGISESTVEFHLKNIYAALQVRSRAEAILKLGKSIVPDGEKQGEPLVVQNAETLHNGENFNRNLTMKKRFSFYLLAGLLFGAVYWFYFSITAHFLNGINVNREDAWQIWLSLSISFIIYFGVWLLPATVPAVVEYRYSQKISWSVLAVIVVWMSTVLGYYLIYLIMLSLVGLPQMEYLLLLNKHSPDFWQNWRDIFLTLILSDLVKWLVISVFVGAVTGLFTSLIYSYWAKKTHAARTISI